MSEDLKTLGNRAHTDGDYRQAIFYFTKAIEQNQDPSNVHVLYSNRSASFCLLEDFGKALEDAEKVIQLKPDWAKGYSRKATALHHIRRFDDALDAYNKGLLLDPTSDVLLKGIQEVQAAKQFHLPTKHFDMNSTISNNTSDALGRTLELQQLSHVIWHLEILHDRIWLADPPHAPFRPRSLFLFDSARLQMLGMAPHATRDPISISELLDFFNNTCANHNIRPGVVEVSDKRLYEMLNKEFGHLKIHCKSVPLAPNKQQLLHDTVRSFDQREMEQWANNPKFSGVLKQRRQPGLTSVKGVTPNFLKYLLSTAASYYRTRTHVYCPGPVAIRVEGYPLLVCKVARDARGFYGIQTFNYQKPGDPPQLGLHSFLFQEVSNIPFDDADLIERHGWDVAEERYPLPVLRTDDPEDVQRPPLEDLKWYEIALKAMMILSLNLLASPTYSPNEDLVREVKVHTHAGNVKVLLTLPPSESTSVQASYTEPTPPVPLEKPLHGDVDDEAAEILQWISTSNSSTPLSTTPLPPVFDPNQPIATRSTPVPPINVPNDNAHRWRYEKAALVEFRQAWKSDQIQREALLNRLSNILLNSNDDTTLLKNKLRDQDIEIQDLHSELDKARKKIDWQSQQVKSQADLIDQLRSRVQQLEHSESKLRREAEASAKRDLVDNRKILENLSSHSHNLLKAITQTHDDVKIWVNVLQNDTPSQRERHLAKLGKPKSEPINKLQAKVLETSRALLASTENLVPPSLGAPPSPSASITHTEKETSSPTSLNAGALSPPEQEQAQSREITIFKVPPPPGKLPGSEFNAGSASPPRFHPPPPETYYQNNQRQANVPNIYQGLPTPPPPPSPLQIAAPVQPNIVRHNGPSQISPSSSSMQLAVQTYQPTPPVPFTHTAEDIPIPPTIISRNPSVTSNTPTSNNTYSQAPPPPPPTTTLNNPASQTFPPSVQSNNPNYYMTSNSLTPQSLDATSYYQPSSLTTSQLFPSPYTSIQTTSTGGTYLEKTTIVTTNKGNTTTTVNTSAAPSFTTNALPTTTIQTPLAASTYSGYTYAATPTAPTNYAYTTTYPSYSIR